MLRNILRTRSIINNGKLLQLNLTKDGTIFCSAQKSYSKIATEDEENHKEVTKTRKNPFAIENSAKSEGIPEIPKYAHVADKSYAVPPQKQRSVINIPEFDEFDAENEENEKQSRRKESPQEREKRLKVLQLEADIANQEGRRVPALEFFTDRHWQHLLDLPSKSARGKYYAFLWNVEKKQEAKKRKKEERALNAEERIEEERQKREQNDHIIYALGHTSMFLRIYDAAIIQWQNNRLIRAMQFAPKIVFDCSYDEHMNNREANYAAKQLMLSFAENRAHDDPFDLHFCNVNLKSNCIKTLHRYIPTMLNPEFPLNIHNNCFTELFPRENLVYLTPHCRTDLETYNYDDVYIIGAMVDTMNNEPLSLAKAKRLGLRMARLPLDRYLQWGSGSGKSLTLNQMTNIMLDLKSTGDWMKSLRHVPRRKVVQMEENDFRQMKMQKRAQQLNVRIDSIFDDDDNKSATERRTQFRNNDRNVVTVRSKKDNLEFNLDTWASSSSSKKKKTNNHQ